MSAAAPAAGASTIVVEGASKWYGNVVAINDVTLAIGPGVTGLVGPNGAGKSTLLGLLAGFLRPSSGRVRVLGEPAWRNPGLYARVGVVQERDAVHEMLTGEELVTLSARLHRLPDPAGAARRAIGRVEMQAAAGRRVGAYSKGMRQRILIASAIVHEPEVLLLDEPFNGTDPRQRMALIEMLREMAAQGATVLFSSHILEEMERLGERVLVIVAGRLAASGDFRAIRRLMADRPHTFTIRASEPRRLGGALLASEHVRGVEVADGVLRVRTDDLGRFAVAVARIARDAGVGITEIAPDDDSIESVFAYLAERR